MKKLIFSIITIALAVSLFNSCTEDSLEPTLAQSKDIAGAINNVDDVAGVVRGMYDDFTSGNYYGRNYIIWGEVRSDNCFSNGNSGRFVTEAKMDHNDNFGGCWGTLYDLILRANMVIGLEGIEGDQDQLDHFKGEAYAARAMAHFDLLRYYGQQHVGGTLGVPYVKVYKGETFYPTRPTVAQNQADIEADIATALTLLDVAYDDDSKEFLTFYGAQALKARVAIYFGDWATANAACDVIIASGDYEIVPGADLANSFLIDGAVNSIFELAYSSTDNNNINGLQYIYRGDSYGDVEGLQDLYDCFDAGDVRAAADMIGPDPELPIVRPYANLGKYPSLDYSDNIPIFRYEEVILNKAEALFRLNGGGDVNALALLNEITAERNAIAHVGPVTEDMILLERRRELCFEGFRFHDLARTGRDIPVVDAVRQTHGGPVYGNYKFAFPIPIDEMDANAAMEQNPGY